MATMAYPEGAGLAPGTDTTGSIQSPSIKRISWSAIFAGVTVAVAVQLVLSLLGAGIGLGLIEPMTSGTPEASSLGLGTGLWWLVSNLLALVAGGYTAAWLAGEGLKAAAPQVAAMTSASPEQMLEQAKSYLQPANRDPATMTPEDAQKELAMAMPKLVAGGEQAKQARERVVAIMAAQLQISPADAAKRFDEAQAQLTAARDQAVQTAKVAADETASAASKTSFLAFAALLLGGAAAAIGGSMAVQRRAAFVAPIGRGRSV